VRLLHNKTILILGACGAVYVRTSHSRQTTIEAVSDYSRSIDIDHSEYKWEDHEQACKRLARQIAIAMGTNDAYEVTLELRLKRIGAEIDDNVIKSKFSVRTRKAMLRLGINTIGDLTAKTADELISVRGFGTFSLGEVREKLAEMGLSLRGE
jgi:DNA-directed RNA polymerase alpha subunit